MADIRSLLISVGFRIDKNSANTVDQNIEKLKSGMEKTGVAAEKAGRKASQNIAKIGEKAEQSANELSGLSSKLGALLAFAGMSMTLGSIVNIIDEWKVVEGQVNNVTKSQLESKKIQEEIYNIASRTRQKYQSTAELFASVARNAAELGKSSKDILAFTEDVANAMLLGGGDESSQKAALVQLGQALGSGTLRGDELNSILEQAPRLAKAIAEGMGTTIGKLRQLGQEGKLTAVDVFNAIQSQSQKLKGELGNMPWTFGQATVKMENAIGKFFKKFEDNTGIVDKLAKAVASVANYIEQINIEKFISGFRLVGIYAGAFLAVSKWGAAIGMMQRLAGVVKAVQLAYLYANGAMIVFQSAQKRTAVLSMIANAKFMLIAAAILLVILAIQDFYTWINGGDSLIGRALGSWNERVQGVKDVWESVTTAIKNFLNGNVIDMIKSAIGWIDNLLGKIAEAARAFGASLKEKFDKPLLETVVNEGVHGEGVKLTPAQAEAYGRWGAGSATTTNSSTTSVTNSGNQTNYINVNAGSTTQGEAIGKAVGESIPHNSGGIGDRIDYNNPAYAY